MKKKILALMVTAGLAPTAVYAQSSVEIYGRANVGIDNWRATGATNAANNFASRARIYDAASRLGFRVNESLGGGMRAFIVMETGVNIDNGSNAGQSGVPNVASGFWASRDAFLGLGGGWGDLRFGRQSIWWSNGIITQASSNYINVGVDALIQGTFGAVAGPVARQSNVLSYNSPTVGGFNASLSYSPSTTEGSAYTGGSQEKDSIWGLTARYIGAPLRGQFDWAQRRNANAALTLPRQEFRGWKAGLGYAYASGSLLSFMTSRIENRDVQGPAVALGGGILTNLDDPQVRVHLLNWEHMLGQLQIITQYTWSSKVTGLATGSDNTKAKGWTLAGKYFLSKRTGIYASYNQIRNQPRAWADFSGLGYSSATVGALTGLNAGADPRVLALGLMHNF